MSRGIKKKDVIAEAERIKMDPIDSPYPGLRIDELLSL